jgi:sterol desaturase/sphingolipid hydroxylase (fatty acid hydroxylase superfamily)
LQFSQRQEAILYEGRLENGGALSVLPSEAMTEFFAAFLDKLHQVAVSALPSTVAYAIIFAALARFPSLACNRDKPWWRNRGLITDLTYCVVLPFLVPYLRLAILIVGSAGMTWFVGVKDFDHLFTTGFGPMARLPLWAQLVIYLVLTDFMMYWLHRVFHGKRMWRYHAIHHSAEDIDWTTAYRFHPINIMLDPLLADTIMLFMGFPVLVLALMAPFASVSAAFVHANLNWTLGPLKYVFASPVFHRWHHTMPDQGGDKNFGSTFSLWDVLFGTFYMPVGQLPQVYGVDDPAFPTSFTGQMLYPFRGTGAAATDQPELEPVNRTSR